MKKWCVLLVALLLGSFVNAAEPNSWLKVVPSSDNSSVRLLQQNGGSISPQVTGKTFGGRTLFGSPMEKKYQWYVDVAHTISFGDDLDNFSLTTSHGLQLTPHIYAGVGLGCSIFYGEGCGLPLFLHTTANLTEKERVSFIDARLGYSFCDVSDAYFSVSYGYRLINTKVMKMSVCLGYIHEAGNGLNLRLLFDF